jgi:hypothetical protein
MQFTFMILGKSYAIPGFVWQRDRVFQDRLSPKKNPVWVETIRYSRSRQDEGTDNAYL